MGEAVEVAKGVRWMRLALPYAINHINVWALTDAGGWTIVDTGAHTAETEAGWTQLIDGPLDRGPLVRVIATHMHPDHIGMAGWLVARQHCELWMTRLEYLTCRVMTSDTGRPAPDAGVRFYRAAGWSEANLQSYREKFGTFGGRIFQLPDSFRRISDGERLMIGEHAWEVVTGAGHSPEHACLYCADLRVLISGDQVLPRISSNVSVIPTEPAADPLREWLASLDKLRERIPDDTLVLPAHDEPFFGLHARMNALKQRHVVALQRLREALAAPARAVDIFGALFRRPITAGLLHMATGEALSNLNYLLNRGEISARRDAEGVTWFQRIGN
jgi:glyoxylase-like metal-dependent hydrolase (beta-lactamase superfamily II)